MSKQFLPPGVTLKPVKSSNLAQLGYHNNTLYVQFATGGLFSYADVTQEVYDSLMMADSIGSHFSKFIKPKFVATDLRKLTPEQMRERLNRSNPA